MINFFFILFFSRMCFTNQAKHGFIFCTQIDSLVYSYLIGLSLSRLGRTFAAKETNVVH